MPKLSVRGVVSRRRSEMGSQDLFQLSGDYSSFWQETCEATSGRSRCQQAISKGARWIAATLQLPLKTLSVLPDDSRCESLGLVVVSSCCIR